MEKKEEKGSIIPFIICVVTLILAVLLLPLINDTIIETKKVKEEKKEENKLPIKYSCSYGPVQDTFYNYIKDVDIEFDFDKVGKVTHINSSTSYQAFSLNEYQVIKSDLSSQYNIENIVYDDNNYIVIIKIDTNNIQNDEYPDDYNKLKKYLSQNGYICSEE